MMTFYLLMAVLAIMTLSVGYAQQALYPHAPGVPVAWWGLAAVTLAGWLMLLGRAPDYDIGAMLGAAGGLLGSPGVLVAALFPNVLDSVLLLAGLVLAVMTIRQMIVAWPLGAVLSGVLLVQAIGDGDRVEMLLQLFFVLTQLMGATYWLRYSRQVGDKGTYTSVFDLWTPTPNSAAARLKHASLFDLGFAAILVLALANVFAQLFTGGGEAGAGEHGVLISAAIVAQLLNARKHWAGWALWVVVNVIGLGVYAADGDAANTALSAVFLVVSVWGLLAWRTEAKRQKALGLRSEVTA